MAKDKNAEERFRLNREIMLQEQAQGDIRAEERNLRQQVEDFQEQMNALFRQEEAYFAGLQEKGALANSQDFALHEIKKEMGRVTESLQEQLTQGYRTEGTQMQDKIEKLQKERNALTWD
jgi:hypothetical protein